MSDSMHVSIELIEANQNQPRKEFKEIDALAKSIREVGLIQPITLRVAKGKFVIVAGERRFRACQSLGWETIPAIILDEKITQKLNTGKTTEEELALIENLQREDLSALEEAAAIKKLIDTHSLSQKDVAKRLSKSPAYISERLSLLDLEKSVQGLVLTGKLSFSQARVISKAPKKERERIATEAVKKKTPVRALENQLSPKAPNHAKIARKEIKKVIEKLVATHDESLSAAVEFLKEALHHLEGK